MGQPGATIEQATESMLDIGPISAALREAGPEARPKVAAAVREALAPFQTSRGVQLGSALWLVTGRQKKRPASRLNLIGATSSGDSRRSQRPCIEVDPMVDEEQMRRARIGELRPLNGPIQLVDYSSDWPSVFVREASRVRVVLGGRVLQLEHCRLDFDSRALAAKPIVDMLLVLADSADEKAYVPAMEAARYVLRIRGTGVV